MLLQIAFYKGQRGGWRGLFDAVVRWWTGGPYSHCELVLGYNPDGSALCASASKQDGGVRVKALQLLPERWDCYNCHVRPQQWRAAERFFKLNAGAPYDTLGLFGFVLRRGLEQRGKWFCSEAVAAALGMHQAWRYDPNTLAAIVQSQARGRLPRPTRHLPKDTP